MDASNYLNLDIVFHRDGDHYAVRAHNSVGNESSLSQSFTIPFTPQERELLTGDLPNAAHFTPQQVGQRLYEALFQGEVRDLLVRSHEQARTLAGLRLRLHLNDAAELALLPWEYLYDAKEARFLALTARLSIVRYLALGEPPQALQVDPPLRVLVVLANPVDIFPQLDVEAEWQQLQTVLAPLVDQGIVELVRLPQPTRNALADHLEQYPVHVLHFVGHGNHDAASGEGGLYLVNEAGTADFVPASLLQVLLADTRDRRNALRLAFLNGCLTGRSAQVDPFAGTAQHLVQHGVPAVIAMQYSVTDGAATELAHRFYRALARSYPVDAALAQARKGVYIQGNYLEWGTPVLFLRAPNGQLFTVAGAEKLSPLLPDVECPYRGLEVFEAEHAHLYFGRENMIQRLVAKVAETNFIAVVGPSGSGKSSLVRAGLIPALTQGALTGSAQWAVATLRPGSDPIRSLISALLQLGDPQTDYASRIAEVRRLANMLMADGLPLADLLDPLHERHPGLVLVVDQFEESFTLCSDPQARDRFFAALLAAAAHDWIKVILTLRADFWGHVLDDKHLGKPADAGLVNVLVMTRSERRAAIEKPAHAVGRRFEEGLVTLILDEVEAERGELPLLEFALTELWVRQSIDGVLTYDAYESIGKVGGAIARRADETFQQLNENDRWHVRRLFTRLVRVAHPEGDDQDTKRRIAVTALDETTRALVQRLANARLLVTDIDSDTGQPTIEIVHEALIRSWLKLKDWLNRDREFLLWRLRLHTLQDTWQRSEKDPDALLRGALLSEAELQSQNRSGDLDEQERVYIIVSRQAENERLRAEAEANRHKLEQAQQLAAEETKRAAAEASRMRTFRLATFIVSVLFLIAVVTAGWAVDRQRAARNNAATAQAESIRADQEADAANLARVTADARAIQAQIAQAEAEYQSTLAFSRQLAAQSLSKLNQHNYELALLLAIESGHLADTPEAFSAIRQAISSPGRKVGEFSGQVALWDSGGNHVLTIDDAGAMQVRDIKSGNKQFTLSKHKMIERAVWSPDGSSILTISKKGKIQIWDTLRGTELLSISNHRESITQILWSMDGTKILTLDANGTVYVWNAQNGSLLFSLSDARNGTHQVLWNAKATKILTVGTDNTVRVWNAQNGSLLFSLSGHAYEITEAIWIADETQILTTSRNLDSNYTNDFDTSSEDGIITRPPVSNYAETTFHIWSAEDGAKLTSISPHTIGITHVIFNTDKTRMATVGCDEPNEISCRYSVKVWNIQTGSQLLRFFPHKNKISKIALNFNGDRIATAGCDEVDGFDICMDNIIRVWDIETGTELMHFSAYHEVSLLEWNLDGAQILAAGCEFIDHVLFCHDNTRTVRIWDTETGAELITLSEYSDEVTRAIWSTDGFRLLASHRGQTLSVWDIRGGAELPTFFNSASVRDVMWNADGTRVLTIADEKTEVWDAQNGSKTFSLSEHGMEQATWDNSGTYILTKAFDNTVKVWNAQTGAEVLSMNGFSAIWSPYGARVLLHNHEDGLVVLDIKSGSKLFSLSHKSIMQAAWNIDGTHIFVIGCKSRTSSCSQYVIEVWNIPNRTVIFSTPGIRYPIKEAIWNGDGSRLLAIECDYDNNSCMDSTVRVWDVKTESEMISFGPGMYKDSFWNTDGNRISIVQCANLNEGNFCDNKIVSVWDTETGSKLFTLSGDKEIRQVLWNGDGTRILTVGCGNLMGATVPCHEGIIRVWDSITGALLITISNPLGSFYEAAWNANDTYFLATGCAQTSSWYCLQSMAQVWNAQSGLKMGTFDNVSSNIAWDVDGIRFLVGYEDGYVQQYYAQIEDLLNAACHQVNRNMTKEEWTEFMGDTSYRQSCKNLPSNL